MRMRMRAREKIMPEKSKKTKAAKMKCCNPNRVLKIERPSFFSSVMSHFKMSQSSQRRRNLGKK